MPPPGGGDLPPEGEPYTASHGTQVKEETAILREALKAYEQGDLQRKLEELGAVLNAQGD